MEINPIHQYFAADITGVDLSEPPADLVIDQLRSALDSYAVIVIRDQQRLSDDAQIAFSARFGKLQKSITLHREDTQRRMKRDELSDISNVDLDGERMRPDDTRRQLQKPAQLWHSDNSFRSPPGLYTFLAARLLPPEGGNTEFADMRAAYDTLSPEMKAKVHGLRALHSLGWSRQQANAPELSPAERANIPESIQPLVRVHPASGRKSLYLSSHARDIIGWDETEGRTFLAELTEAATQPAFVYSHAWRDGDLVIWDNRDTMHRATPFRDDLYKRDMRRTSTADMIPAQAAH